MLFATSRQRAEIMYSLMILRARYKLYYNAPPEPEQSVLYKWRD